MTFLCQKWVQTEEYVKCQIWPHQDILKQKIEANQDMGGGGNRKFVLNLCRQNSLFSQ